MCRLIPGWRVQGGGVQDVGKVVKAIGSSGGHIVDTGVSMLKDLGSILGIDTGEFVSQCCRSPINHTTI